MDTQQTLPIRLVALDLDGTLFNEDKIIPPHTLDVLNQAIEQGVVVIPATGRPATGLPQSLMGLTGLRYALTSNGAQVVELATNRSIIHFPIQPELAIRLVHILSRYDCLVSFFSGGDRICFQGDLEHIPQFLQANMVQYVQNTSTPVPDLAEHIRRTGVVVDKINAFFRDHEERRRAWQELEALPDPVVVTSSLPLNMEVNAPDVTKGRALMALAEHLGLAPQQVMACGDSGNDLAMIQAAGLGVAMANATPEVLAAADYVTLSNQEEGVASAVEKFVLHR